MSPAVPVQTQVSVTWVRVTVTKTEQKITYVMKMASAIVSSALVCVQMMQRCVTTPDGQILTRTALNARRDLPGPQIVFSALRDMRVVSFALHGAMIGPWFSISFKDPYLI